MLGLSASRIRGAHWPSQQPCNTRNICRASSGPTSSPTASQLQMELGRHRHWVGWVQHPSPVPLWLDSGVRAYLVRKCRSFTALTLVVMVVFGNQSKHHRHVMPVARLGILAQVLHPRQVDALWAPNQDLPPVSVLVSIWVDHHLRPCQIQGDQEQGRCSTRQDANCRPLWRA